MKDIMMKWNKYRNRLHLRTMGLNQSICEDSLKLCTSVSRILNIDNYPLEENDQINRNPLYSKVSGITNLTLLILGKEVLPNIKRDHRLMMAKFKYYNSDFDEIIVSEEGHLGLTLKITKNNNPWIEFIKDKVYMDYNQNIKNVKIIETQDGIQYQLLWNQKI
ncbi:unnamed protein product [Paramecium sonneborni]|uniref:Uncharacterized protein n=1 Tax=Paramecium sonneborni TaxID=65129 RepID=A0A8S1Q770_9CILI|nr:unnamed protein product [Paramecium sonneborni]